MLEKNKITADILLEQECWSGNCFSDEQAFLSGKGVCYIPEYHEVNEDGFVDPRHCYTREDLVEVIKDHFQGCTAERKKELLALLFYGLDWQFPETLALEMEDDE